MKAIKNILIGALAAYLICCIIVMGIAPLTELVIAYMAIGAFGGICYTVVK